MISQLEHIAHALYDAENDGPSWNDAPEAVKEAYRRSGYDALLMNAVLQQEGMIEPHGPLPMIDAPSPNIH